MKKHSFLKTPLILLLLALFLSETQICFATSIETDTLTVNGSETVNGSATMNGVSTMNGITTMNKLVTMNEGATVNGHFTVNGTTSIPTDWANPGAIGSTTPNTIKGTTIESTTGLTVDSGGIVSKDTVAAGGSNIVGQADSGAAIASGNKLGNYLLGGAKDASHTMNNSAGMSSYATENWSGSAAGANLKLEVTPNGSTTRSMAVTINQDSTVTLAQPLPIASGGTGSTSASTGTGGVVLSTSPTLTTPNLGTPSALNLSNATALPLAAISNGLITNAKLATPPAFKIVTFTRVLSTASGTQVITGVGFTPKAVIFIYGDNVGASAVMAGVGMDSIEGATSFNSLASYPTNQFYINGSAGSSISAFETASNAGVAYISATSSDGFTLSWSKWGSPTGTLRITALCFG